MCFRKIGLAFASLFVFCAGVLSSSAPAAAQSFTLTNTNADGAVIGSYPNFTLTGGNNGSGSPGATTYVATFGVTTTITFNWNFTTADIGPQYDPAGYVLNGVFTRLTTNVGLNQSGSTTVTVQAGQNFGWEVNTTDNQFGAGSLTISATAFPQPTVTSIAPKAGPPSGGTAVTISGTDFTGATAVMFGATNATGFTVNSATSITATSPAGSGTVDVTVTTQGGASPTSAADRFTYVAPGTNTAITSSQNPSFAGQAVTFTATVTTSGGTPTGTITFLDNGAAIGTGTLTSGVATFTTSTLSVGSHTITVSYSGSGTFSPSVSPGLVQLVNVPQDSLRLRQLQVDVTKVIAQNSGQAISGAIDGAISEGFSDGGVVVAPSGDGIHFNFAADLDNDAAPAASADYAPSGGHTYANGNGQTGDRGRNGSRVDDAFAAIDQQMPKKAVPKKIREERDWLFWVDVRGTGLNRLTSSPTVTGVATSAASLYGLQINALAGLTYKVRPNFLVGVVAGYENFSFTEQDINGKLTGEGWTIGSYMGWRIAPTLRYDLAVTYSGIDYNGAAGTAQGNFNGERWMVSTGLTGTYKAVGFTFEPSTKVYALWEREGAYVDSLGTAQSNNDFLTGRASTGLKMIYPLAWTTNAVELAPYVGLYGDYYFNQEDAAAIVLAGGVPLASTPLLQGWSARATAGINARFANGWTVGVGTEYGGLGSDFQTVTFKGKAQVPF